MPSYNRLGMLAIVGLVALRVCVGWHFYMEGVAKVRSGDFSSAGFLGASVGPLAPMFQSMLNDSDGRIRTDYDLLISKFDEYGNRAAKVYGFNEEQVAKKDKAVAAAKENIGSVWASYGKEIREYRMGFDRIQSLDKDKTRGAGWLETGVASLAGQRTDIESKWKASVKPALKEVDLAAKLLSSQLASIATEQQRASIGEVPVSLGGAKALDTKTVDKIIPIFDMVVGILLMIGLLTPVAGVAGGLFLVSVVLTQFPGYPGAQPTYYQAIEALACFVIAFSDAGRYAGLDFIPWAFWHRSKKKTQAAAKPNLSAA